MHEYTAKASLEKLTTGTCMVYELYSGMNLVGRFGMPKCAYVCACMCVCLCVQVCV